MKNNFQMHVAQNKTDGEREVVRAPSTGLQMGQGTALPYFFEYRVAWKKDLGRMFYELARMDLSGRQWRLAERLVKCTLGRGYLGLYVPNWDFLARSLRWKAKDVGDVLNGYSEKDKSGVLRSVKGLVELGIVRVRRCGLDKGFVVVLVPAVSRWDVAALYSPAEDAAWLAEVDAVRLAFAAQPECAVIAEQFPDLASEVDGMHAAAVLAVRAPGAACMPRPVDARQVAVSAPVAQLAALARCAQDARPVDVPAPRVAGGACAPVVRGDSYYGNAENHGNSGAIPRMGRVAGASVNGEQKKQLTVQPLNSYSRVNDENRLLADLKAQFVRAHGQAAADAEMVNYGGAWRQLARGNPDLLERETSALKSHIDDGRKFSQRAWFAVAFYVFKSLGVTSWPEAIAKNFKESFK